MKNLCEKSNAPPMPDPPSLGLNIDRCIRLALPLDVLRMVKSTIVPTMTTTSGENDEDTFVGNPWVWQRKLLFHYAGQDTVLAERMSFIETCRQKPHESIAEFESRCKYHGSKCEYNKMANPEQELIRDRFVTGIYNDKLRAELLRHKKDDGTVVTLAEVANRAKAWEAANNINVKVMESQHTDEQVNYTSRYQQSKGLSDKQKLKKEQMCGYCGGKEVHNRRTCPAGKPGVCCRNCYGANHFAIVCRSSKDRFKRQWLSKIQNDRQVKGQVNALDNSASDSDEGEQLNYYAMSLDSQCESIHDVTGKSPKKLFTSLSLSNKGNKFKRVPFQVDTAATCNTMPFDMYLKFGVATALKPTRSTLFSYCGNPIKPLGTVTLLCEAPKRFEFITFQVVNNKDIKGKPALLGVADSVKLELIKYDKSRVHMSCKNETAVADDVDCPGKNDDNCFMSSKFKRGLTKDQLLTTCSEAFTGLGSLGKPVSFVLDPKVHPVHAPIQVKKKLDEMVADKKLLKVEEPTDWCSNMTVVEKVKESGEVKIRLCLDPSQTVNKAIVRPKYAVPTLQELLPKLSSKTYKCFTIVDALDGFTQVQLDEMSSFTTTMQTPWGRYRWLRLPYGISSAPEEFQRRIHEALDGLEGVFNIADDVLIYGLGNSPEEAEAAHDKHLNLFMQRILERNPEAQSYESLV